MIEHIDSKKDVSDGHKTQIKSAGSPDRVVKGESFSGIPQYIIDRGQTQTPVQRQLDDKDIGAITRSGIDPRLSLEFSRVYEANKDHIHYGKSEKGGEAFIEDGHFGALIDERRGFFRKHIFKSQLADILRQSAILHEVTHLAVMDYNIRRDQMSIPGAVTPEELAWVSSSEIEVDRIRHEIDRLFETMASERGLLESLNL